ncbi:DUF1775 domain-containing protein [Polyangium jinanense]|uniref:DUF1775 domain-containing protein n=1 Tax=Polyangium jinanense TaxID=2829994 RepID=A0A9X3XF76_9BACT|nr:DUF1775 domain-containing protein [Polyangium jinanense]MDC3961549.1 DUF1775 domain-containing protein [Polyangium jinanense]MDC3987913.1 DUF1775 domain-containing protein [Polyangium jinanense]
MEMKHTPLKFLILAGALAMSAAAEAHISAVSPTAIAGKTTLVELSVGHGCEGSDTYAITVEIPKGMTSVRPMFSDFGKTSLTYDAADPALVTTVTWQKDDVDALPGDTNYYTLAFRARVPNAPFTSIYYKVHQVCRAADATLSYAEWVALPGEMGEPAAAQAIVPDHLPGWNKYTVPADIADLSVFFSHALIVWRGADAYSFNDNTVDLIKGTSGVTLLPADGVKANDEIWVRY